MDSKTKAVFVGWRQLSLAQRRDLQTAIEEYNRQTEWSRKRTLEENIRDVKHYLGPVGTGCPCCGR